ncbi:hypothetical protein NBRC116602_03050 [Hyphomicrobiales bacterium 4NK60-0047b]|jgi:hypothetical protein
MKAKSLIAPLTRALLTISLLVIATNNVKAEENIPNLVGTWSGENKTISDIKGYKTWKKTIQITEQKDRRFKGHFTYSGGRKNFFGVIYPDNISFTWVASNSRGFNHGRIHSKDTISACYVESGIDATTGCAKLRKQK